MSKLSSVIARHELTGLSSGLVFQAHWGGCNYERGAMVVKSSRLFNQLLL